MKNKTLIYQYFGLFMWLTCCATYLGAETVVDIAVDKLATQRSVTQRSVIERPVIERPVIESIVMPSPVINNPVIRNSVIRSNIQSNSTATLPLKEILRLYQQSQKSAVAKVELPPMAASINEINITSQLLENAMQIKARFNLAILSDDQWVSIPLFVKDNNVHIYDLPKLRKGYIVQDKQHISYITNQRGSVDFEISMLKKAVVEKQLRQVDIQFSEATKTLMAIGYDENLFKLAAEEGAISTDGDVIYPIAGLFSVKWQQTLTANKTRKKTIKPPLEPMIKQVSVSSIATLEGELITRALYNLHFEGTEDLSFVIPNHYQLKRVYLNGSAIPFVMKGKKVTIEVLPSRAGDRQGSIELTLVRQQGKFHLAGALEFNAPLASWPIREMFMKVYLPDVFNYSYEGGSMSISEKQTKARYTYDLPTPGKAYRFHQSLITSSAPSIKISYAINLKDQYFRGN